MQGHRLSDIAAAIGARRTGPDADPVIEHLGIDSRKPFDPANTLFIALRGERHDGHRYIPGLIQRGARFFVVDETTLPHAEAVFLHVPDTLAALQQLAAWHRSRYGMPVIGITGSNGKTVVKEWLFQALRDKEHIVRSPGSWNSQVGVPLSVWAMAPEHTLAVFEVGISRPGEMERLARVVRPTIGVFTNVGPAHAAGFSSEAEKAREKALLFAGAEAVVFCADHVLVKEALRTTGITAPERLCGWSTVGPAWMQVSDIVTREAHTGLRITCEGSDFDLELPFTDHASIENALHCTALLLHLGHAPAFIAERMRHLVPVAMRLETAEGTHGTTLVNDAYSNDLASLTIALDHLVMLSHGRPKAVVVSDITGSGETPARLYGRMAAHLARAGVDQVVGVGPGITAHAHLFPVGSRFFADTDQLLEGFGPADMPGHVVLVKGARSFTLERAVERWQRQVHGTVLEIDLEAVRHNLNHHRALIAPGVRTMVMLKAFGYGAGALELARLLAHEQVHYLGVAYADEGIELRQNGIRTPVMVMNPEPVPFEAMHRYRLEPEVYDPPTLNEAIRFAELSNEPLVVHIKLDTGMHRLGFGAAELTYLLDRLRQAPMLRVGSILSHLVASEDPSQDAFTRGQIEAFASMSAAITGVLDHVPLRHIANSAAIRRFPEAHFDMVRLGIGLHGIGADAQETALLRPVATLKAPVALLRDIPAGDTVSYNRRWTAERPTRLAVLPIGYADGLPRRAGNGVVSVWFGDQAAPIVGTVCMDMCMVDVTGLDVAVGDMALLFGAGHPVSELAERLGTIPYEVLTSIAQRVKRVHVRGSV